MSARTTEIEARVVEAMGDASVLEGTTVLYSMLLRLSHSYGADRDKFLRVTAECWDAYQASLRAVRP